MITRGLGAGDLRACFPADLHTDTSSTDESVGLAHRRPAASGHCASAVRGLESRRHMPNTAPLIAMVALSQVWAPLAGKAVDPEGRPVAGVEILVVQNADTDGKVPVLARSVTDASGRYELRAPKAAQTPGNHALPSLCAYRPGMALLTYATLLSSGPDDFQLTFEFVKPRRLTIRDGAGNPLSGVRVAPVKIQPQPVAPNLGIRGGILPDELTDRIESTSGPDGVAEINCLAPATHLLAVRLTVPQFGRQELALPAKDWESGDVVLEWKPVAPISGRVRDGAGQPVSGASVELWTWAPLLFHCRPVNFAAGPLITDPQGFYRTPAPVLPGQKYRVVVRAPGMPYALSDWGDPETRPELPVVELRPGRTVAWSGRDPHTTRSLSTLALIDPQRAVNLIETTPEPVGPQQIQSLNSLRIKLAEHFSQDAQSMWASYWFTYSGFGPFLRERDLLR
jgi:hypothetical protein